MTFGANPSDVSSPRYSHFNEQVFRSSVDNAMKIVQQILEANRNPRMAEDVDHQYENKYKLAEQLSNMAIASHMNGLEQLGLTLNILQEVKAAASTDNVLSKSVTLRFQAAEACTFLKEQIVEVPSTRTSSTETMEETHVPQSSSNFSGTTKKTTSIHAFTKRVEEYHWKVDVKWVIRAFWGSDEAQGTELQSRSSSMIVVTQSKQPPIAQLREHPPVDVLLNWFVQHVDPMNKTTVFHIKAHEAKTPRRNAQVDEALDYFRRMQEWATNVQSHFTLRLEEDIVDKHNPVKADVAQNSSWSRSCSSVGVLIPILPVLDDSTDGDNAALNEMISQRISQSQLMIPSDESASSRTNVDLSGNDCMKLLNEHVRSLEEKMQSLQRAFPSSESMKLFSIVETKIVVLCEHLEHLCRHYEYAMDYIEGMLEKQLLAAIGKRVTIDDLEEFVRFHNARFLQPAPKPFCHAIGRPNHYPFGVLSIERTSKGEPIDTLTREVPSSPLLKVPLTAATTVNLKAKTYLHGWMNFRSKEENISKSFQLVARARQFSSFLLVVGTMVGADELQPKDAIIIQNKDEVVIPLLLNELPSVKEFKDAIQSLSPEQRRFAESFRRMQLASSVFGVAVIQIKPQLEKLLGLPEDALAKEIKLTQDLMELFVEHQVPSDLLSYDGDVSASVTSQQKVDNVQVHVDAVLKVINSEKEKQLEEATMKADMAFESAAFVQFSCPPPSRGAVGGRFGAPPPFPPAASSRGGRGGGDASSSQPRLESTIRKIQESKKSEEVQQVPQMEVAQGAASMSSSVLDFSAMPRALDRTIEKFDKESALRSTVIKTTRTWRRKRQENLLKKPSESTLQETDVRLETNKGFDLLDALSRSGSLPISYSDLHVILCVSHCFQKSVTDTVIRDNINPIERLELSTLLLGSVVHGTSPHDLVTAGTERERIESTFPALLNG